MELLQCHSQVPKSMFWEYPKLLLIASIIKILICRNNGNSLTESSRKLEATMSYEDSKRAWHIVDTE